MSQQNSIEFAHAKYKKALLEFLNYSIGIIPRLKEMHWKSVNKNLHNVIDDLTYENNNLIDTVMELSLAYFGKNFIDYNECIPTIYVICTSIEMFDCMNNNIAKYRQSVENVMNECNINEFTSIISSIDKTLEDVNRAKYLSDMD